MGHSHPTLANLMDGEAGSTSCPKFPSETLWEVKDGARLNRLKVQELVLKLRAHARTQLWVFVVWIFFFFNIYLFFAVLGLRCCTRAFLASVVRVYWLVVVDGFPITVAFLVAVHRL